MARFTTIVTVVSSNATELVVAVEAEATNVGAVTLASSGEQAAARQLAQAWAEAERRRTVYTLTDFDVLQPVMTAWADRLLGRAHELDVAAGLVPQTELPEYLLVADSIDEPEVHWYQDLLRGYAPRRVITVRPTPAGVLDALSHLRPERAFPTADVVARRSLDYVPTGLTTPGAAPVPTTISDRAG